MENFEMIILGIGVTKSLLLLLLSLDNKSMKDSMVQQRVNEFLGRLNPELGNRKDIREMLTWIEDDNFKTKGLVNVGQYEIELHSLKENIVDYYFNQLEDISKENPGQHVFDVQFTMGQKVLQLQRLRMVIEPEVQISKSQHPVTGFYYLASKGFWIEDDGQKKRKYTRSLGRIEQYPDGITDKKALKDGVEKIRKVIYEEYRMIYNK
jgi:hypothetical protein